MQKKGKITNWNDDKGFGFITPKDGGKQIFVHIKAFKSTTVRPKINQVILYDLSKDNRGRICAINVLKFGEKPPVQHKKEGKLFSIFLIVTFFISMVLTILTGKIPMIMLPFYVVVNIFTYIIYAIDKSASQNGSWRTPENTLHLLALAGGWSGAIIAQKRLRHKSKKQSFRITFWLTVIFNIALFVMILTPKGSEVLKSIIF